MLEAQIDEDTSVAVARAHPDGDRQPEHDLETGREIDHPAPFPRPRFQSPVGRVRDNLGASGKCRVLHYSLFLVVGFLDEKAVVLNGR